MFDLSSLRARHVCAVGFFFLVACGGGPRGRVVTAADALDVERALGAYEDYVATDGDDVDLLARVARALLLSVACGEEAEEASLAVREMAQAGLSGRTMMAEVVHRDCAGAFDATVLLARRGDEDARRLLRGMADNPEPRVRAAVVISLSPELDRDLLLAWAADPSDDVRAAASERLGALGPEDADALALLMANARNDASARVRSHAVRALGSYEGAAFEALRERLSDPEGVVRMAAVEALVRADRDQARSTLFDLLATPPSPESIEAARVLLSTGAAPSEDDRTTSLAYLRAALSANEPSLRAQAAVVLVGLPGRDDLGETLRASLRAETDPNARLSMARALLRREDQAEQAHDTLQALLFLGGMVGVQAAAILAEDEDLQGLETLRAVAIGGASETSLRVVAVHAMGRHHAVELAPVLRDTDVAVRLGAAGAIAGAGS